MDFTAMFKKVKPKRHIKKVSVCPKNRELYEILDIANHVNPQIDGIGPRKLKKQQL